MERSLIRENKWVSFIPAVPAIAYTSYRVARYYSAEPKISSPNTRVENKTEIVAQGAALCFSGYAYIKIADKATKALKYYLNWLVPYPEAATQYPKGTSHWDYYRYPRIEENVAAIGRKNNACKKIFFYSTLSAAAALSTIFLVEAAENTITNYWKTASEDEKRKIKMSAKLGAGTFTSLLSAISCTGSASAAYYAWRPYWPSDSKDGAIAAAIAGSIAIGSGVASYYAFRSAHKDYQKLNPSE